MNLVQRFIQRYGRLPTEFDPDYLEMLRMTKYKVLDAPHYKPSKCANCGSTKVDGRKYIDFGLEIDWYGIIYICSICMEDITYNVGLFEKYVAEIKELKETIKKLIMEREVSDTLVDRLTEVLKEVKPHLANISASTVSSDSDWPVNLEPPEPTIEQTDSKPTAVPKRTAKPTTVSGSKNVSSLADLLNAESN